MGGEIYRGGQNVQGGEMSGSLTLCNSGQVDSQRDVLVVSRLVMTLWYNYQWRFSSLCCSEVDTSLL